MAIRKYCWKFPNSPIQKVTDKETLPIYGKRIYIHVEVCEFQVEVKRWSLKWLAARRSETNSERQADVYFSESMVVLRLELIFQSKQPLPSTKEMLIIYWDCFRLIVAMAAIKSGSTANYFVVVINLTLWAEYRFGDRKTKLVQKSYGHGNLVVSWEEAWKIHRNDKADFSLEPDPE